MDFQIIQKEAQIILSITKEVLPEEIPEFMGSAFNKLADQIAAEKGRINGEPFVSFKYLDANGDLTKVPVMLEVGMPLAEAIDGNEEISCYRLDPYQAVTTVFAGDDADLELIYHLMVEKIRNDGQQFLHKSYEYYATDEATGKEITRVEIPFSQLK